MGNFSRIILKSGKDRSILKFHPWIFSGAIKKIEGIVNEGDIVAVYDNKEEFLGYGHYQIGTIAVRVFSFENKEPNDDLWRSKLQQAILLRKQLGLFNSELTNVFRLIHGEGDGLPGFICDFYKNVLVFQFHSIGMFLLKNKFAELFKDILGDRIIAIYDKSASTLPYKAQHDHLNQFLLGNSESVEVLEYGNKYSIDFKEGQKTGFFIDQRENRKLLEFYSKDNKVLNMFCYTGGFSVAALKGGAKMVHSVDSSQKAIDLTNKNIEMNYGNTPIHQSFAVDAFDYLDKLPQDEYNTIVLDPPAFAKHFEVLNQAMKGYERLNRKAIEKIAPGGILFTFSCSQVVSKDYFRKAILDAGATTKRKLKILHQLTQPADHPISIYHPEAEYLKGLVIQVE